MRSSTQFRCEGWLLWTAAAEAGRSGVEVWLDEGLGIDARDITIAIENPRCLAISVPFLGRRTLFVSAHGPVADTEEEQIRLWWDTLAAELATVAQEQNVVLLIDANASLNDEAGIHWGGSEATKENMAGTTLKELVAERALCIPQTFSKFGPTWGTRRLDFIVVPLDWQDWHAAVSDTKVEPPDLLAISDFVDHRAVTITVTLRREKCQNRERRLNFECAAILTPEAKAQFESIWAQAPTPPATWARELIEQAMTMRAQETPQAVCPLGTPAPKQPWITVYSWAEIRVHSIARQVYWGSVKMQKEAVKRAVFEAWRGVSQRDEGVVAGRNVIAEARLETARLGRLLQPLVGEIFALVYPLSGFS